MKSLIALWKIIAHEMAIRCSTSTTLDCKTVECRVKHEGLSFLTITLPSFGKEIQKSLDQGIVAHDSFLSFKRQRGKRLPAFLQGFSELVFDPGTGVLLENPSVEAIFAIRQLTLTFGKMHLPCSYAREKQAMDGFIQCEEEVRYNDAVTEKSDLSDFIRIARVLFRPLLTEIDREIYNEGVIPKHGPGSTADRLSSNGKYNQREWTTRLEEVFHVGDFLFPNARYFNEHYDEITFLEPDAERPVRVISVPKTQKTPRIIAIEPTVMQYAQQGLLEQIISGISKSYLRDLIGTESQEHNQLLAQKGSSDGTLATLDLSEASDRVSNQHVRALLSSHPNVLRAVEACRSRKADVPGYGVVRLAKFASMGSALCFPIEAMVFLTLVFLGIERSSGHRFTNVRDCKSYIGQVRIYGDDIVVPVDHVHTVVDTLEHFGARVGTDKSFWIGRFRESCGKEYYEGQDVSIVKVRRMFPTQRQDVPEVISLVELRNHFYKSGCWHTAAWLDRRIREILPYFPNVDQNSQGLGRFSFLGYDTEKEDEFLHRPLVKAYVVTSSPPRDHLDGAGALLKYFLKRGEQPFADEGHLGRSGRPRAVYIKPRWVTPY